MTLIKCPECGHNVSTSAESCPGCGAPVKVEKGNKKGCLVWFLIFLFIGFIINIVDSPKSEKQTESKLPQIIESRITSAVLNVRVGPGASYKKTGEKLQKGKKIYVEKKENGWIKFRTFQYSRGTSGWCIEKFTQPEGDKKRKTVAAKKINKTEEYYKNRPIPDHKILGKYQKSGRIWYNILISSKTKDDLITLAIFHHSFGPNNSFRFFDDASRYREFMLWDQNYPDPKYPSPESWTNKHYIALINKMYTSNGPRWQLLKMPYQEVLYEF